MDFGKAVLQVKIAYEKKFPDASECDMLAAGDSITEGQYTRMVAAYDGTRLIGVGGYRKTSEDIEAAEEWSVVIHPQYARRDIESNMKRLLS